MPENDRKLSLHSPAGSEHATYRWPLLTSDTWNEAVEIVDTIRWVCHDFPELKLAVENYVLNDFDPTSFDSMKQLCERYNRAVDNIRKLWSGRQPPDCIDSPPSVPLLKHIMNQVYNRAVTSPEALNSYEPFSPEVYGETSFDLVAEVIKQTHLTENDVFVDLGSGIGQVVLQVAAITGCKCYGIEKAEIPASYAKNMEQEFIKWMEWYGKSYGEFEINKGDFLDPQFAHIFNSATVIFVNNFAFGPKLNHELKLKFSNLADGTKIVSSHEFCPLNFRITTRNLSDIGSMMHVAELSPLKGHVSWTGKPVTYYLHVIDRGKLEKFFRRQKHPEEADSDDSSRTASASSPSEHDEVGVVRRRVGHGKKSDRLESDDSEESSLDSSDNDFEEQIRKIKSNREFHHQANHKKSSRSEQPPLLHSPQPALLTNPLTLQGKPFPHKPPWKHSGVQGQRSAPGTGVHRKTSQGGKRERKKGSDGTALEQGSGGKRRGLAGSKIGTMDGLFGSIQDQLSSYVQQLESPEHQQWVKEAIEKEKLKQQHLQVVIQHLESEVSNLSKETIRQMEESMFHLGITTLTPAGLLVGAKSIVSHNRQLRLEMKELEREVDSIRGQNDFMEMMCKEQLISVPKVQSNGPLPPPPRCPPNGEPRVPPLPNEIMASDHMTSALSAEVIPSTKKWNPNHTADSSNRRSDHGKWRQVEHHAHQAVLDPSKYQQVVVNESVKAGINKDFADHLKDCEIYLERIDQELLELGPFAKDIYGTIPLKEEPNPNLMICVPGMGGVQTLNSEVLMRGPSLHQQSSRRSRKGNRLAYSKVVKRKSEDGYATSPMSVSGVSLSEDRTELQVADKITKDGSRENPPKWKKIGSAGSPVVSSSIPPLLPSKKPSSNSPYHDVNSPVSDSRLLSPLSQAVHLTTSKSTKTKSRGKGSVVETDIESPSMIPAASEIEMLSLYMPNTHWETIGSSPLPPDHESPEHSISQSTTPGGDPSLSTTNSGKSRDQNAVGTGVLKQADRALSQSVSSLDSEATTSSERLHEVETDVYGHHHHPPLPPPMITTYSTAANSWPSPLTTSVARHSPEQAMNFRSVSKSAESTPMEARQSRSAGELRRHVIVKDGTPVVTKPSFSVAHLTSVQDSAHRNTSPPFLRTSRDTRSATPVERANASSPAGASSHGSLSTFPPPHHYPDGNPTFMKHRRSSSSSSLRSIRHHSSDEGGNMAQPIPSPQQKIADQMAQQQHNMQFMAGKILKTPSLSSVRGHSESPVVNPLFPPATNNPAHLTGQPNLLAPPPPPSSTAAAVAAMSTGFPCYPFPNPFLAGGSWLSPGGVLTTGLPQLHSPMFSLDPNSPYKQVLNPALLPYRYPFPMTQALKNLSSQASVSALSGVGNPSQVLPALPPQGAVFPVTPNPSLSVFQNVSEANTTGSVIGQNNSAAPSLLQMQGHPSQPPQAFSGMIPMQVLAGTKDDKADGTVDKVQGFNWMQNPTGLMGSGFGMLGLMGGQGQLGMGAPGGVGVPGSQQTMNLYNSHLPTTPVGSDTNLAKIPGALKDNIFSSSSRKTHQQRRGSSASVDMIRDSVLRQREISPSKTPPLGIPGTKKSQYTVIPDVSKWKSMNEQQNPPQVMMPPFGIQTSTVTSPSSTAAVPPGHVITNPSHMIPVGFPQPVVNANPPGSSYPSTKGRGDHGSPKGSRDKMKFRIHQVRNDDFNKQVKVDKRRRRWSGKESMLASKSELAESAIRRIGIGNEQVNFPMATGIPALPASLGVEPGSKMGIQNPEKQKEIESATQTTSSGNYNALKMLADMSSIQSKEEKHPHSEGAPGTLAPTKSHQQPMPPSTTESSSKHSHLRSPVSLAARSLLMLAEDLNTQEKSHDSDVKSHDVENTAANSLLQLSGAIQTGNESETLGISRNPVAENEEDGSLDVQKPSQSASISAAEAMIMMGSSKKSDNEVTQDLPTIPHRKVHPLKLIEDTPSDVRKQQDIRRRQSRAVTSDSEATDTDSEATLTPESPTLRKNPGMPHSFILMDTKETPKHDVSLDSSTKTSKKEQDDSVEDLVTQHTPPPKDHQDEGRKLEMSPSVKDPISFQDQPVAGESHSHPPQLLGDAEQPSVLTVDHPSADNSVISMDQEEFSPRSSPHYLNPPPPLVSLSSSGSPPQTTIKPLLSTPPPLTSSTIDQDESKESDFTRPKFISTFGPAADSETHSPVHVSNEENENVGIGAPIESRIQVDSASVESTIQAAQSNVADEVSDVVSPVASDEKDEEESSKGDGSSGNNAVESLDTTVGTEMDVSQESRETSSHANVEKQQPEETSLMIKATSQLETNEAIESGDSEFKTLNAPADTTEVKDDTPPKVKVPKVKKNSISHLKDKPSHGKIRTIKIKRTKSPKVSPPVPPPLVTSNSPKETSPPSWTAFADEAMRCNNDKEEVDPATMPELASDTEKTRSRKKVLSRDLEDSSPIDTRDSSKELLSSGGGGVASDPAIVPQNRLKIKSGGLERHHHHHHKQNKRGEGKVEEKTKRSAKFQHEHKARELFDVDHLPPSVGAHKEMKRDWLEEKAGDDVKHRKIKLHSSSSKSKHLHSSKYHSDNDDPGYVHTHRRTPIEASPSPTHDAVRGHSHNHDLMSKSRIHHPSGSQGTRVSPANQTQPLFSSRERDFSPLSDDSDIRRMNSPLCYPPSKELHSSTKWSEEEDRKHKSHRRHQASVDNNYSTLPSPSSSTSSGSKKHYHRHHDHTNSGFGSDDQFPSKHNHSSRGDKNTSRGPSPDRKRHHRSQHHHHYHSSHEGRGSHSVSPVLAPLHSVTSTGKGDTRKQSYESISDDDMFDISKDEEDLNRRGLHEGGVSSLGGKRKRRYSDEEESGDPLPVSLDVHSRYSSSLLPGKQKKAKYSKEKWKEGSSSSKHKHSHKQH